MLKYAYLFGGCWCITILVSDVLYTYQYHKLQLWSAAAVVAVSPAYQLLGYFSYNKATALFSPLWQYRDVPRSVCLKYGVYDPVTGKSYEEQ